MGALSPSFFGKKVINGMGLDCRHRRPADDPRSYPTVALPPETTSLPTVQDLASAVESLGLEH